MILRSGRQWMLLFLLGVGSLAASATAQSADKIDTIGPMDPKAHPTLEVATIKLSDPAGTNQGIGNNGNRLRLTRETLTSMMMFAYGVQAKQIVGGPDWMSEQAYDVRGVPNHPGEPSLKQMQELVTGLMVDRFALKIHREQRDLPHLALVVAKAGPKLERSKAGPDEQPDQTGNGSDKGMSMTYTNNSMPDFVLGLNYFVTRPVVNQTGLTGRYTFTLKWTPDSMTGLHDDAAPALYTALEEQLGLKLEPAKGPVEVIVIDHVERPSPD
jgi:uncharacterized protein (TIGR03435 family)